MRKISLILVAAMLLSTASIFANDPEPKDPKKLSTQIWELLRDNPFVLEYDDLTAHVRFTLNGNREIVVLSVTTDDESLETFVKGRLNYQKVELTGYHEGKIYIIPVRITG